MRNIIINGTTVKVSQSTFMRIEKIANERRITLSEAVLYCLEKVK